MFAVVRLSGAQPAGSRMVIANEAFTRLPNHFRDLTVARRGELNQLRACASNPRYGTYRHGISCSSTVFLTSVQSQSEHQRRRVHP
jgi:hypothetical protein